MVDDIAQIYGRKLDLAEQTIALPNKKKKKKKEIHY